MQNEKNELPDRRTFLATGVAVGAGVVAAGLWRPGQALAAGESQELPALPYAYDALEPHIDKLTMEIHHDKHHAAYIKNLNTALESHADLKALPMQELLWDKAEKAPEAIRQAIINNGGGHANHTLFWTSLAPADKAKKEPAGALGEAIQSTFGGTAKLAEAMNEAGTKRFGSGWSWLVKNGDGKLEVYSTGNQDSPLLQKHTPLLGIDVWEHAYYLKYQNRRPEYLKAIWNVIDWSAVEARFGK